MKLSEVEILKLLPVFMKDDEAIKALSKAVDQLILDPGSKFKQLRVWDQIDFMDDNQLDDLAWEFNIDWYSSKLDIESKRRVVKISDQVHKKRGTKWAVEQLISAYFGPGYVEEWFEYEGPPFEFKVLTTNKAVTDEMFQEFLRITKTTKNERSRLEGIYYFGIYSSLFTYGNISEPSVFPLVICGTKPKQAIIGQKESTIVNIDGNIESASVAFEPCGTVIAGTKPETSTIGVIDAEDAVAAIFSESHQAFSHVLCGSNKAGTTPSSAYVSGAYQAPAAVSNIIGPSIFNPVKCGTTKTGEVI